MDEDPFLILLAALAGAFLLAPWVVLLSGWNGLRRRAYARADTLATLVGVWSWILLGLESLVVAAALEEGMALFSIPAPVQALLAYPPSLWFFARALTRSTKRRREEDLALSRDRRVERREIRESEARRAGEPDPPAE